MLALAAQLQASGVSPSAAGDAESISLDDLGRAAAEAGIDPAYVTQAAALLGAERSTTLRGKQTDLWIVRSFLAAATDVKASELEADLASELGPLRRVELLGGHLAWDSVSAAPLTRVTIVRAPGETRIIICEDLSSDARNIHTSSFITIGVVGGGLGMIVVGLWFGSPEIALPTLGLAFLASATVSRFRLETRLRRRAAELAHLADAIMHRLLPTHRA